MMQQPTDTTELRSEEANIEAYPNQINHDSSRTITFGDMHGNAMKLLWCLIREGVIEITPENFDEMWDAYDEISLELDPESNEITQESQNGLKKFLETLETITANPSFKIRLLGDVLADRGENDYLTLKVLEKLCQDGVKPEIIFSNHDAFFLSNYKKPVSSTTATPIIFTDTQKTGEEEITTEWFFNNINDQQRSMVGLFAYIKFGLVKQEEVQKIVNRHVIPNIKLISYSLSEDKEKIDLFMHAPNDFNDLKKLAEVLGVVQNNYEPKSAHELATTIEHMNSRLQKLLAGNSGKNIIDVTANRDTAIQGKTGITDLKEKELTLGNQLSKFIWNILGSTINPKVRGSIDFNTYPTFVSHVVHGHINIVTNPNEKINDKQIDLDTTLGKSINSPEGQYLSFLSNETVLGEVERQRIKRKANDGMNLWIALINSSPKKSKTTMGQGVFSYIKYNKPRNTIETKDSGEATIEKPLPAPPITS